MRQFILRTGFIGALLAGLILLVSGNSQGQLLPLMGVGSSGGAPATETYLSSNAVTGGGTSHTWTSVTLGTGYPYFVVALGCKSGSGATITITSATIAGVSATQLKQQASPYTTSSLWIAPVNAASGNIVVNSGSSCGNDWAYGLWGVTNLSSATPLSTGSGTVVSSGTINVTTTTASSAGVNFFASFIWNEASSGQDWSGAAVGHDFTVSTSALTYPAFNGIGVTGTGASMTATSPAAGSSAATSTAVGAALR